MTTNEASLTTSREVARNTGYLLLGELAAHGIRPTFGVAIARLLTPDELGSYAIGLAAGAAFVFLADLGVSKAVYRETVTSTQPGALVRQALEIRLLTTPVAALVLGILVYGSRYPDSLKPVILIVGCSTLVTTSADILTYAFKAIRQTSLVLVVQLANAMLLLCILGATAVMRLEILGLATAFLLKSVVVVAVACALFFPRHPSQESQWADKLAFLKRALPLGAAAFIIVIYSSLDTVILSAYAPLSEVGYYRASSQLASPLAVLGTSLVSSLFPYMVTAKPSESAGSVSLFYRASKILLALGVGLGAGATILASKLTTMVYGGEYEPASQLLPLAVWTQSVVYLSIAAGDTLLAQGRRRPLFYQTVISLAVFLSSSVILVPTWGALGAAGATFCGQLIGLAYLWYAVDGERHHQRALVLNKAWRAVLAAVAMCAVLQVLAHHSPVLLVPLGAGVYCLMLWAFNYFTANEYRQLLRAVAPGTKS